MVFMRFVSFCLNSNRVASFTSATCGTWDLVRPGRALINLVPQVGRFLLHGPSDSKDTAFLRFMTWRLGSPLSRCIWFTYPRTQPWVWIWPRQRYSCKMFLEKAKTNQTSAFFLVAKKNLGGLVKVIGNSNPACWLNCLNKAFWRRTSGESLHIRHCRVSDPLRKPSGGVCWAKEI